jgi:hypothetical protein
MRAGKYRSLAGDESALIRISGRFPEGFVFQLKGQEDILQ